jgi:hypothetical protein
VHAFQQQALSPVFEGHIPIIPKKFDPAGARAQNSVSYHSPVEEVES